MGIFAKLTKKKGSELDITLHRYHIHGIQVTRTFQFIDVDLGPMNGDIRETHKEKRK